MYRHTPIFIFFFFNDTATTEIYTLSLHDALPISLNNETPHSKAVRLIPCTGCTLNTVTSIPKSGKIRASCMMPISLDRKSTRLNSSHDQISYAVFCLKKKKKKKKNKRIKLTSDIH